jgi:hypothetical protein
MNNLDLYYGENIQAAATALETTSWAALAERMRNDPRLKEDILRMRRIRSLEEQAYDRLKVKLPYFCTGQFSGGLRRGEFFEQSTAFIMDIDGCGRTPDELRFWRKELWADEGIAALFTSPGGDGLKLLFLLREPVCSTKQYSDFYKAFAFEFGAKHRLNDFIDHRTSDCTRVCFLSHDADLLERKNPNLVDWRAYEPLARLSDIGELDFPPNATPSKDSVEEHPNASHNIRPDVYADILKKLETRVRPKPVKYPYVPSMLEAMLPEINTALAAQGIELKEATDIQYGKKLQLNMGKDLAEINVFFGKKGFSVVNVPKRQSNESLAQLAVFIVEQVTLGNESFFEKIE